MREPSIVRPIVLLSAASFASVATMRVADPLLPQVAREFGVTHVAVTLRERMAT